MHAWCLFQTVQLSCTIYAMLIGNMQVSPTPYLRVVRGRRRRRLLGAFLVIICGIYVQWYGLWQLTVLKQWCTPSFHAGLTTDTLYLTEVIDSLLCRLQSCRHIFQILRQLHWLRDPMGPIFRLLSGYRHQGPHSWNFLGKS